MKQTIIYHDNCPDGFGSAWWLGKHIGEHTKFAANYDKPPPPIEVGSDVFLVDFCYPPDELTQIMQASRRTVILDHHQTADQATEGWGRTDAVTAALTSDMDVHAIVIDQDHSGVGLVSEYVRAAYGAEPPLFLANLEDRDLWRFALDDTRDVFAAVTARPYTEEAWDDFATMDYDDLVIEGRAINLYRDRLIEQVAASTFTLLIGNRGNVQVGVQCATSPYAIGSDVAGLIAEQSKSGIGAYAIIHQDNVQIGLRSRGDGPDVAFLAEQHGGGGHKHASGLRLSLGEFNERHIR